MRDKPTREKLRKIREANGYTQQSFADAVGISRQHYCQIENGDKMPSYPVAIRIKKMLNYSKDDLFKKFFLVPFDPNKDN